MKYLLLGLLLTLCVVNIATGIYALSVTPRNDNGDNNTKKRFIYLSSIIVTVLIAIVVGVILHLIVQKKCMINEL